MFARLGEEHDLRQAKEETDLFRAGSVGARQGGSEDQSAEGL